MSVLHGGCRFPFLAEPVYQYLVDGLMKGVKMDVTEIPNTTLQFIVKKVIKCTILSSLTYSSNRS